MAWTINTSSFETLGVDSCQLELANQAADRLHFAAAVASANTAALAYGDAVVLREDAAVVFRGKITSNPPAIYGASESVAYTASGPWHDLDNLVLQQQWTIWNVLAGEVQTEYRSRVILGQSPAAARLDAGEVIAEIVAYAAARGVAIAAGTIGVNTEFPFDEIVDLSCGEAIRRVLRWIPDAVAWIDYAPATPTLNVTRRSAMANVARALGTADDLAAVNIAARYDLLRPSVRIVYERTDDIAGTQRNITINDIAPVGATGLELGALIHTVELGGMRISQQSQKIEVQAIPADLNDKAWWKARVPWLADIPDVDMTITGGARDTLHEKELIKGSVQDWMSPVVAEADEITAKVAYVTKDAGENFLRDVQERVLTARVTATSAASKTYYNATVDEDAEPVPTGIAAALYSALSVLEFAGSVNLLDDECDIAIRPGKTLSLTGGVAAWAAMAATIQSVTHDIASGGTAIAIGPPAHLGPADLIDRLRANRARRPAVHASQRADSLATAPSTVEQSDIGASDSVAAGGGKDKRIAFTAAAGAGRIEIDPDTGTSAHKTLVGTGRVQVQDAEATKYVTILSNSGADGDIAALGPDRLRIRNTAAGPDADINLADLASSDVAKFREVAGGKVLCTEDFDPLAADGTLGDILYYNGTDWVVLAAPSAMSTDPFLRYSNTSNAPYWEETEDFECPTPPP